MRQPPDLTELAERFAHPDAAVSGPVPIWWWSGAPVRLDRLAWQMEQLLAQGVAQAVVMNLAPTGPLYGSLADDPHFLTDEWWALFLGVCAKAAERGFRLWPYDQIGFSGANFQGRLVSKRPSWAGLRLGRVWRDTPGRLSAPQGSQALAAYLVRPSGSTVNVGLDEGGAVAPTGGRLVLAYAQAQGFDYFNAGACATLLDTVHGEFDRRASQWFGSVIPGFFQDELPNMPTWGPRFAETFLVAYGYDLLSVLPALWDDPLPTGIEIRAEQVRVDFHSHRAACGRLAFFDPLERWFRDRGLECGFDQQSPAREGDPAGSVHLYGDYTGTHGGFSAPGSDHWGDSKVHSSLAQANGHHRTWIEAFHSSGWGGTLEETYDWLAPYLRRGATVFDPHAVYYATPGGWWEWAPPSTCWRQPYWPEYHVLSAAVARLCALFESGSLVADTILVFPTTAAQANTSLDGPLPHGRQVDASYHGLNGHTSWFAEKRGILERAGLDYSIFDEAAIARATLAGDVLTIGGTDYRNIVVGETTAFSSAAASVLARFAESGGRVVVVGEPPDFFAGSGDGGDRFDAALHDGLVVRVARAADVPQHLRAGQVQVEADAPAMLRRVGDVHVLALFAHDEATGTEQPMLPHAVGPDGFWANDMDAYWSDARRAGYRFRPVTDRAARVALRGIGDGPDISVQQWDPRTGARRALPHRRTEDGRMVLDTTFDTGSVTVLVVGPGLPPPTEQPPGPVRSELPVTGPWTLEAASSLDNRWGDLGPLDRRGVLPMQVWQVETADHEDDRWQPATATFGPFVEVTDPVDGVDLTGATWRPAEFSLSRGLRDDPAHRETLGPKGYVLEEFLHWNAVPVGATVGVRTTLSIPDEAGLHLVVGSGAGRAVLVDGIAVDARGDGYWSATPITGGRHTLELRLRAGDAGALRASFAVVRDLAAYARPEWLVPADGSERTSIVEISTTFTVAGVVKDARVQVGSEQPCTVMVNGVEVGRQSAFDPYEARRFARFHPYDIAAVLRAGNNELLLRSTDNGRPPAIMVDAVPTDQGGLGLRSGCPGWRASRDGVPVSLALRRQQWQDPRFACLVARPHPLPDTAWLAEDQCPARVVVPVVPDIDPAQRGVRLLRFDVPIGAVALTVPTAAEFTAEIAGTTISVENGRLQLPAPAAPGTVAVLRFPDAGGRRGGALLDGPIDVEAVALEAELADWTELGLRSLGGQVTYRISIRTPASDSSGRWELDLGVVRGAVEVRVDGVLQAHLAWSPYRADVTDALGEPGTRHELEVVVRGGLAGYLGSSSPTPAVFAGQDRGGLRGPVRLRRRG